MTKSVGELRMNIVFKDGNNDSKQNVLERAAREINHLEEIKQNHGPTVSDENKGEFYRSIAMAETHAEQSALNAVKALSY